MRTPNTTPEEKIIVQEAQRAEWDRFVNGVAWATPQHSFAWGNALSSCFGYLHLRYRLFYKDGRIAAGLPLVLFTAGGPFRAVHSLVFDSYGGPLIDRDFVNDPQVLAAIFCEIDAEAAGYRAFEARLTLPPMAPESIREQLEAGGRFVITSRDCPVLNLHRPLDKIIQGYQASVRRAIRRSSRESVQVQDAADLALVYEAYPLYRATMARIGGTPKPWRFLEHLSNNGLTVSFVAMRQGRPVGLVILLVSTQMAIYWISAADLSQSSARPTNALVDSAIQWCHRNGVKSFSFGESPGERASLQRFKEGWGTEAASTTTAVRTYRPLIQRTWQNLQPAARRAYSLWEALKQTKAAQRQTAQ